MGGGATVPALWTFFTVFFLAGFFAGFFATFFFAFFLVATRSLLSYQ